MILPYSLNTLLTVLNPGTLSYVIALALIFTRKYDDLAEYPVALTSMIIVTIAGGPGRPMGACFQGAAFAVGGVLLGSAVFAILAKLASVPVAQAVVFAAFVYGKPLRRPLAVP